MVFDFKCGSSASVRRQIVALPDSRACWIRLVGGSAIGDPYEHWEKTAEYFGNGIETCLAMEIDYWKWH